MNDALPSYGLWSLVLVNSAVFIIFAFSFFKPQSGRDWRTLGMYSAFVIALFTEMYGFPLTIYLLSGWLTQNFPGVDFSAHDSGHLLEVMFGWGSNPHFGIFHLLSGVFIFGGFWLLASAWRVLYTRQTSGQLATEGPYARIRHPQYVGFVAIMIGFLLQWPTLVTLIMFPILLLVYARLARREEVESAAAFGDAWASYAKVTPAFLPNWSRRVVVGKGAAR